MSSALVTGSSGYIGRHVVNELISLGITVLAVDIQASPSDYLSPNQSSELLQVRSADILDKNLDVTTLFDKAPDVCIHLAWRNGFKHNDPSHMLELSAHYHFLSSIAAAGVKHIAIMGSMHEVGYWEGPVTEETPCNPLSFYGIAKDALRRAMLLKAKADGLTLQWLRGFYIYGDDEESQSIFGKLLRAARSGQKTFPFTTGKNLYDFLTVQQLAHMIACASIQIEVDGIINCCSGLPMTLADRMEQFIADNKLDIALAYGAFPDRAYDSPGIWGDASKINYILSRFRGNSHVSTEHP